MDFAANGLKWDLELCLKDSDGDGLSNGLELGDPCCLFNEEVAEYFPQAKYGLGHPGFDSSIPFNSPVPDLAYCQEVSNTIEEKKLARFTRSFQDGEKQLELDFTQNNYTVPSSRITTYAFPRFSLPNDKEYDIVAIQPVLDPKSAEMVHHFVVVGCSSEWEGEQGEVVFEDEFVSDVYVTQNCFEVIWAWAPGLGSLIAPPNAGYHIGKGTTRNSIMLEVHYDNPLLKPDVLDFSGVRLYFREGHRPQEFGVLLVGPGLNIPAFPNGKERYYVSTMVPVPEVNETVAPEGVTVFASFAHAHVFGRKIFSSLFSRSEDVQDVKQKSLFMEDSEKAAMMLGFENELVSKKKDIDIVQTFSFANQRTIPVSGVKLNTGDFIGVGCEYNSMDATEYVVGGWGTRDEMCLDLIYVWPIEALNVQGYTTTMVTPYDWIGRVVTGDAKENAVSLETMGIEPWIDFQSEMDRIGCPEGMDGSLMNLTTSLSLLEEVCGMQGLSSQVDPSDPFATYYPIINAFNSVDTCTKMCGAYLSASLGCLVSRYGTVVNKQQGWDIVHGDFPDLQTADDIFYLGYWWALYHNFPQMCDNHLSTYILADASEEAQIVSKLTTL
eukprot:TRINITY_DN11347_c0_g1_i1.p1 TRINITY_DN11347_c0_g1~~TRINITY_DN11347_c0_g1_i1.p1  ORF type:complete len:690 (+),score=85.16 TRINITY_DN11347_c0_g1_i1:248-2071(+)